MTTRTRRLTVDGHRIDVSRTDKVLFPGSGLTKGDLVRYYGRIAPAALRYYRDRALSMERFPDGIAKKGFFQKDIPGHFPDWIGRVELDKEDGTITHVVADSAAVLVYLANQGCITPHLALSRRDAPDRPDRMIFDLDPSDGDFQKVRKVALLLRRVLEKRDMTPFVQTTGSRGLHVVVPLDRKTDFDSVRDFTRNLAANIAGQSGSLATIEQRKAKRGDRVFIDYLRNAYGQTSVAPYAVRARENAPVATPVRWGEVESAGLSPRKYTITNIFRRLAQTGDPWEHMDDHACPIP